jgi:uncharacterized protein (TIGR02646 family)
MIKVKRPPIPTVLADHQQEWTEWLMDLVSTYGGFDEIPGPEKQAAVNKYRHDDIKLTVREMFHGKCVYCESNVEVCSYIPTEHFYPKSLYPQWTFEWRNLFPACNKCNIEKGEHDTYTYPIVNPEQDDPEMYFIYQDIRICPAPTSPDFEKSKRTIEVCNLKRITLSRAFSDILLQFYKNEEELEKTVSEYHGLTRGADQIKRLSNIHESLENLKATAAATEPYAGFLRYCLRNSEVVRETVTLINTHQEELALTNKFEFY